MPIAVRRPTRRLEETEFRQLAFVVLGHVFEIHNEFGRFFEEAIYKRELARRLPNVELEVPLEVTFEDFRKLYFLDVLVEGGALSEFKAVEHLVDCHRSQLLHYLLLSDLSHGKLVNVRSEQVQHEFVNSTLRPSDRQQFTVAEHGWRPSFGDACRLREWFLAFLADIGTCLDLSLYEEALTHVLGGEERVVQEVPVVSQGVLLGKQKFRLMEREVALKVTTLNGELQPFEVHARRLLEHTGLHTIHWINVARSAVTFTTISAK